MRLRYLDLDYSTDRIVFLTILIAIGLALLYVLLFYQFTFQSIQHLRGQGDYAFFPIHIITTLVALLAFIGLVQMIYMIEKSNQKKFYQYSDNPDLLDQTDKAKRESYVRNEIKKNSQYKFKPSSEQLQVRWLRHRFRLPDYNQSLPIIGLDAGASIAIVGLLVAMGGAFLTNFIQIPILDYQISPSNDFEGYSISIDNYGNSPAKHVQTYLDQPGTIFQRFIVDPFLGEHLKSVLPVQGRSTNSSANASITSTELKAGQAFFEIDNIPAFSRTEVSVHANIPTDNTVGLPVLDVRSDETVGKRGTIYLLGFYACLFVVFVTFPTLFWMGRILRTPSNATWIVLFVTGFVIFAAIITGFVYRT